MSLGSRSAAACRKIAIEGTHGSGKTTLALAITATLKSRGVHAAYVGDVARDNAVVEASLRHGRPWDLITHLHLIASQLADEQRAAFEHHVLVCDRTVLSWLAYAKFASVTPGTAAERAIAAALEELCRAYVQTYDAVFFLRDLHDLSRESHDTLRPASRQFQEHTQELIAQLADANNVNLIALPTGLPLEEHVACVTARCADWLAVRSASARSVGQTSATP